MEQVEAVDGEKYLRLFTIEQIKDESRIVWNRDPNGCPYVRETLVRCGRRRGQPPRDMIEFDQLAEIVGWAELEPAAPSTIGMFWRRIFWVKSTDRYCDPHGVYEFNAPIEAVDPLTVAARIPGRLTPRVYPRYEPGGELE